jgi:DNA-directed RNA polymerase specialized sigma24 family protein
VRPSGILGDDLFVERIKKNYVEKPKSDREVPGLRALNNSSSRETEVGEIESEAKKAFGKRFENSKDIAIFLIHKYSGRKLKEIGNIFGLSVSGVSSAVGRVEKKISRDLRFSQKVREIEDRLFLKEK